MGRLGVRLTVKYPLFYAIPSYYRHNHTLFTMITFFHSGNSGQAHKECPATVLSRLYWSQNFLTLVELDSIRLSQHSRPGTILPSLPPSPSTTRSHLRKNKLGGWTNFEEVEPDLLWRGQSGRPPWLSTHPGLEPRSRREPSPWQGKGDSVKEEI